MENMWTASYQSGVPAEINPEHFSSIKELYENSVKQYANNIAVHHMGMELTYAELDSKVLAFAAFLQKQLKLNKGDRIAIMMPNMPQYYIALFGAFKAGLTVTNVNPLYTPRELKHQLKDSGAKAIVIMANFAKTLEDAKEGTAVEHIITTQLGDQHSLVKGALINFVVKHVKKMVPAFNLPNAYKFNNALKIGEDLKLDDVSLASNDIAFLQYTGGTTGVSKGAVLLHRNMLANVEQAKAWLSAFLDVDNPSVITALPLYHIFALTANCLTFFAVGGKSILITNPKDIPNFVKELKNIKFVAITGVNTLFNALLNNPNFKEIDFSSLKISLGGGMAVQRAVADRWKQVTNCPLVEAYGLTEASPAVCMNPLNLKDYNGSIGLPIPSTYVEIRDEDGKTLAQGEVGELCVKGPQVMPGYWQNDTASKEAFTSDGWLRTGDMARLDEKGFVFIVDRKKDMIIVSGFNVYPNEVENIIALNPKVLEVAVIGVPDDVKGEVVKAVVVKKDESLTAEEVIEQARQQLTRYKVPRVVEFVAELPKTNVGKILRRALRD